MRMKRCPACDTIKSEPEFGRNRSLGDGLSFYCLACMRVKSNAHYRKHREALGKTVRDHTWIPEGFKWCPSCAQPVARENFNPSRRSASGLASWCKACRNAASSRAYFYRRYGLTSRELRELRRSQDDKCAICGVLEPQHLDHDHATGHIRRLLCQRCNHGLGLFRDDPTLLRAAADYVQFHTISQHALALFAAAGIGPVRAIWPGQPPVGSA